MGAEVGEEDEGHAFGGGSWKGMEVGFRVEGGGAVIGVEMGVWGLGRRGLRRLGVGISG